MIDNATDARGFTGATQETVTYGNDSIIVGSAIAAAGYKGVIDLYAHELAHTIGPLDLYSSFCYNQDATLMHCNASTAEPSHVHLDPFYKMRLAWATPRIYDANYPGGTLIDVAPLAGQAGNNSPIILQEPRRDPNEFYMIDYRNPEWNGGVQTVPGESSSGYDAHAAGRGFGVWYCNTDANDQPIIRPAVIGWGDDGHLDSTPAPGSDDYASGGWIFPGPDGILQSSLSGDDFHKSDRMAFLSTTPADYVSRRANTFHGAASGPVAPQWFDRTAVGDGLQLRFYEVSSTTGTAYVSWGKEFIPFLDPPNEDTVRAGCSTVILGNLGIRDPFTFIVSIVNDDWSYDLEVEQWTPAGALVKVPPETRPGDYRLIVYRDQSRAMTRQRTTDLHRKSLLGLGGCRTAIHHSLESGSGPSRRRCRQGWNAQYRRVPDRNRPAR